jgi:hypothetical protein
VGLSSQPEEGVDASIVESKLLSLANDLQALKSENDSLKAEATREKEQREAVKKAAVAQAVELAISSGKITADKKDEFIELGMINEALLHSTLNTLAAKTSFSAGVKVPAADGSKIVSSVDDFQKLSLDQQLSFKNDHPDAYKKLFS